MSRYYRSILNVQGGAAIDPDAQAFLTATGITDATITSAINNLVVSLKSDGLWAKMKAIYPFVGGTATTHKFNLKDPRDLNAAYRITWFGGVTHSANGVQGNGTNGYGNTYFLPNSENTDSLSGFFNVNQIGNTSVDFGAILPNTIGFQANIYNSSNNFTSRLNQSSPGSIAGNNATGFYGISRTSSSNYNHNNNGTKTTINQIVTGSININVFLLAINAQGLGGAFSFSSRRYASFYIGEGLTTTEQDNLQTADLAFQTALGR